MFRIICWGIFTIACFLVGFVVGGIGVGYLTVFEATNWMGSISALNEWPKILQGGIIFFFTKTLVIFGGCFVGFFFAIPGMIGVAKAYADDED